MQSIDARSDISSCSDISEASLDMSSYEIDETVLTRRQKQIAYGKNTEEYEFYARQVHKMNRTRKHPATPDKFDRVSRRRFDGRIRSWKIQIHRWYEEYVGDGGKLTVSDVQTEVVPNDVARDPAPIIDENTVTMQAGGEGTMTEAPTKQMHSSPVKSRRCAINSNIPGMEDESAVDPFSSPVKAVTYVIL